MSNIDENTLALVAALQISRGLDHGRISNPDLLMRQAEAAGQPLVMILGGRYNAAFSNLSDGAFAALRFTVDGKLMTDSSSSGGVGAPVQWSQRYYQEITVTDTDQAVSFGFDAMEVTIINDDSTDPIYIDYGGAAVANVNHDRIDPKQIFLDNFLSDNVHLIAPAGQTASVRVWARAI